MAEKVNYWLTPEGLAERAKEFARFLTVRTFNNSLQMFAVEGGVHGFLYRTDLWYGHVCDLCAPYEAKFYRAGQFMKNLPQHPWCYSDDTEVYTDEGWKLFPDLNGEQILSLNPETFGLEWLPYSNPLGYEWDGELVHIHHKWFDLLVTPHHSQIAGFRLFEDRSAFNWRLLKISELVERGEWSIPRTAKWVGYDENEIEVAGYTFDTGVFARFMGYFLSDGSTTKRGENWYQTGLKQYDEERLQKIYESIQPFPFELNKPAYPAININDVELGRYLAACGHGAANKRVPSEVKGLSPRFITEFLDAYMFGDGHEAIYEWDERGIQSMGKSFSTSSSGMSGDLGECILKAGGYPSFWIHHTKGTEKEFRNGVYTINNDQHYIGWNRTKTARYGGSGRLKIDRVPYSGMVYDVELPRNHVLWVRRNGKTCWSGNCRCWYDVIVTEHIPGIV